MSEWTGASASPSFCWTICHWGLFKRSCQQVVQLSAHPCWSVGAFLTARKERHRERARERERRMFLVFLSVRRSDSLAGDAMGGRSMQDKRIPTVHCSGPAKSSSQDGRELKASLYDNHPWYYSHYDDDDLQMSLSLCVCVRVCVCVSVCACTSVNTSPLLSVLQ